MIRKLVDLWGCLRKNKMGFVITLLTALGGFMWIVAAILVLSAVGMVFGFLWFKRNPIRVIVLHKRADQNPLIVFDRCGRMKDKDGEEWYKLFFAKKKFDIPDTKFLYSGRGILNKQVLVLWEENGKYTPVEASFAEGFHLRPIDKGIEDGRQFLSLKLDQIHDTTSWLERNKGFVVTLAGVFIVIVVVIVLATKGGELKGMFGGIMGSLAPFMFRKK